MNEICVISLIKKISNKFTNQVIAAVVIGLEWVAACGFSVEMLVTGNVIAIKGSLERNSVPRHNVVLDLTIIKIAIDIKKRRDNDP